SRAHSSFAEHSRGPDHIRLGSTRRITSGENCAPRSDGIMAEERKRILWADAEIDLLRPHMKFLEDRGFQGEGVTNGEDAVALASDPSARYDLVILDEMMPGIGGLETLQGIKEQDPYIPIIMVTKSENEELIDAAIRKDINNYL